MKNLINDKKVFYAGLVYLISIVIFILLRVLWGTGIFDGLDSVLNDFVFATIMQLLVLTAIPIGLWMLLCKQNFKQVKERFFIKKVSFKTVIYSLLIGILTYVLILFVSTFWSFLLQLFGYSVSSSGTTTELPVWLAFLMAVVSTSFLPGFGEELAHRGLLLGNMRNNGLKRAILLSALMFGLAHLNVAQFGYAFVVGLILGASTMITRSIFPAMIIHATSNFCSLYLSYASAYGWFGGGIMDTMTEFITSNWFAGLLVAFLILLVVLTLLALLISRLFVESKQKKFDTFCKKLYESTKGTEMEKEINFNDKLQLYSLFSQAAAKDLKDKIDRGDIPITHLEREIGDNPLYSMIYSEFDKYQKPKNMDYLFYYIAIFLGSVVTLITFIWGIL